MSLNETGKICTDTIYVTPNNHMKNIEILEPLSRVMVDCYGPFAGFTILNPIPGSGESARVTKDGVSILTNIGCNENEMVQYLYNAVKKAAVRNDLRGGDGTTSTALLAIELYKAFAKAGIKGYLPTKAIYAAIDSVKDSYIVTPKSYDTLVSVAHVALNNNAELSGVINSIYEAAISNGKDWRNIDIHPRRRNTVGEDKTTANFLFGVRSLAQPEWKINFGDNVKAIYVNHSLSGHLEIQRLTELINAFYGKATNVGKQLLIAAPKIEKLVADRLKGILDAQARKAGVPVMVTLLELISPVDHTNINASNDCAVALGMPIIQLLGIPKYDDKGNNVGSVDDVDYNNPAVEEAKEEVVAEEPAKE